MNLKTLVRHLKGRPFANKELERQYITDYRMAGLRVGYLFSWMAAFSFLVFSLVEYFVLGRGMGDTVQQHRALMIAVFSLIGLHAKLRPDDYEKLYEGIVPILIFCYASAILYFEYHTQLVGHPEFFYLSVNSTCLLLTIASYYFMRLPILVAAALSFSLAAVTLLSVYLSGVFDGTVVGRMLTYIGVSNVVGLWIRIIFDVRERKIFLQKHQMKNVAALRKRLMLAEAGAHQAKTKLLAMLSHEIRTPMNTVARLMGLVRRDFDGQLSEKRVAMFRHVEQSCDQLLATLDDLLHLSASSSLGDRVKAASEPFELASLMQECADLVSHRAREKGIALHMEADEVVSTNLLGQPHHLKRVLLNLLVNAIKFTSEGVVSVFAAVEHADARSARIAVAVKDTGIGIPREEHEKIFQLFYQVESSYARRYGGSGLGLAISRELVEAMGGTINLASEVGKGSTFTITMVLPWARDTTETIQCIG